MSYGGDRLQVAHEPHDLHGSPLQGFAIDSNSVTYGQAHILVYRGHLEGLYPSL